MNIEREGEVLRPYHSAGEVNFHRGLGITLQKRHWQASFFGSYRKIDANLVIDSLRDGEKYVSSLQTSGYHRTRAESDDKGIQRQLAFGTGLAWHSRRFHLGVNAIWHRFYLPIEKPDDPYNNFGIRGRSLLNFSLDYGLTYRNLHFFGEIACTAQLDKALVTGLLLSASPNVDIALLYRDISRSYYSLNSDAFTESVLPVNERGLYTGIAIRPGSLWRVDAYADLYRFPWLKYRVDKPSVGSDLLIQATFKPNKQLEIYGRYRNEKKEINSNPDALILSPVIAGSHQDLRIHLNYSLNPSMILRNRVEMSWFNRRDTLSEEGFLAFADILYKPPLKRWSASLRLQYFETGGYNSRIYAFENDVLYAYSIPASYDKGGRYYININYDVNKKLAAWIKWSQTLYRGKSLIGSGLDEISGSRKSEIRLQVMYKF
jgi:hypothetical protein